MQTLDPAVRQAVVKSSQLITPQNSDVLLEEMAGFDVNTRSLLAQRDQIEMQLAVLGKLPDKNNVQLTGIHETLNLLNGQLGARAEQYTARKATTAHSAATQPARVQAPDQKPTHQLMGEYYMFGEINRPGAYAINDRRITLFQTIVSAGWPAKQGCYATLLRRDGDHESTIVANVPVENTDAPEMKTTLLPNDIVTITTEKTPPVQNQKIRPSTHPWKPGGEFYISGTQRDGAYKRSSGMTLRQALISAGGPSDRSNDHLIQLWRQTADNDSAKIEIRLKSLLNGTTDDLDLQPNDRINIQPNKP